MANEYKVPNGLDLTGQKIVNLGDPSGPQEGATKAYVDNAVNGLAWKQPVRAASTANLGSLSGPQTVGGVSAIAGERVRRMEKTTTSENGVYVVAAGAWARASDSTTAQLLKSATYFVAEGSNADKAFTQTADSGTAYTFAQVGGGTAYTADGNGITLSGTTFALALNGATLAKSASGLKVNDAFAGNGLQINSDVASVKLDTASGLVVGAGGLKVDRSVVMTRFAQDLGSTSAGTPIVVTHNLGTKDVAVAVYEVSSGTQVMIAPTGVTTTQLTLTFNQAITAGQYRVVVMG